MSIDQNTGEMKQMPKDLADALSEHSPQVEIYASALFPMPTSPTGWVLVRPMVPFGDDDLVRLGDYLTAKHRDHEDADLNTVEGIVRTVIADMMLVITGSLRIDDFAPEPVAADPPPEPIEPDRTPFTMMPPPLPAEPPAKLPLPPALRARVDAAKERVAAHTASDADNGRARDTVYAGIPHPYQAREGAIGYCDCGMPAEANVHAPARWREGGGG